MSPGRTFSAPWGHTHTREGGGGKAPGARDRRPGPGVYLASARGCTAGLAGDDGRAPVKSRLAAAEARTLRGLPPSSTGSRSRPRGSLLPVTADRRIDAAHETLDRATRHLLGLQHEQGWWKGELETNVTIDAEDLFLRHYLGILEPREAAATATWIRSRQRPDGSWATYFGGPGDLSTSVEAYVALRLAGDPPDAAHMRSAAAFVREAGGVAGSRVFTRMWLSLLHSTLVVGGGADAAPPGADSPSRSLRARRSSRSTPSAAGRGRRSWRSRS